MSRYYSLMLVIACKLFTFDAHATDARVADDLPHSMGQAIEVALRQRSEMQSVRMKLARASSRIDEVRADYLPRIDFVSELRNIVSSDDFTGIQVETTINGQSVVASVARTEPRYQATGTIELAYEIYSGGRTSAQLEGVEAEYELANADLEVVRRKVIAEVVRAYCDFGIARIRTKQAVNNAEIAKEMAQQARREFNEGQVSQLEKDNDELKANVASMELEEANVSLKDTWAKFLSVVGLPIENMHAVTSIPPLEIPESADVDTVIKLVSRVRPELARHAASKRMAVAAIDENRADMLPQIELFGDYSGIGRDHDHMGDAMSDLSRSDIVVGIRLSWNLFNGGKTRAKNRIRRIDADLAELDLKETIDQLHLEYRQKDAAVEKLKIKLDLAKRTAAVAEKKAFIAQQNWDLEKITATDLKKSKYDLQGAQWDVAVTRFKLVAALVELRLAKVDSVAAYGL